MENKKQIDVQVGKNIKREREKAGYTQERFSEMIGIGPKSLSAIERGTVGISLSLLLRITKLLGISTDTILLPERQKNEVDDLVEKLQNFTPQQFLLAKKIINTLSETLYT